VEAEARLVYLRHERVHAFSPEELQEALRELEKAPGILSQGLEPDLL